MQGSSGTIRLFGNHTAISTGRIGRSPPLWPCIGHIHFLFERAVHRIPNAGIDVIDFVTPPQGDATDARCFNKGLSGDYYGTKVLEIRPT